METGVDTEVLYTSTDAVIAWLLTIALVMSQYPKLHIIDNRKKDREVLFAFCGCIPGKP